MEALRASSGRLIWSDQNTQILIDLASMLRMDNRRGIHLDDDGRAAHTVAGPQLGTIININGSEAAIEIGAVLFDHRVCGVGPVLCEFRQADLLDRPYAYGAQVDELHGLAKLEAIDPLVRQAETRREFRQAAVADPIGVDLERKFVSLAEVADIGLVIQALP